ncbi:MAG: hypothetical protein K8S14_07110 [Actinomycetia bacterium]|nr:hypothetical protein [Actinomycetes bacterium]
MIKRTINLLPKEEKKRDVKSVVLNIFVVLVILLFLAAVLVSLLIFDIDNTLSSRLSEYEGINMKIQDQVNKLKVYSGFNDEVDKKKTLIKDLQKNEIIWSKILYDIGRLVPEGVYLKIFDGQGKLLYSFLEEYKDGEVSKVGKQIISFSINGDALEYKDVLKLAIELKKIDGIERVWIQNIVNTPIPEIDKEVINFTIDTFWDIEPFTEDVKQEEKTDDEDVLDSELGKLES